MTPRKLIILALKLVGALGVGQTPLAEDTNDAFDMLNMMVGQWAQKRWLVYNLADVAFPATGVSAYAIGPGAVVNTARPDRIESAFARMGSGVSAIDYPLEIIEAREDYNLIAYKGIAGFPASIFYDSGFPLGTLNINPVPSSQFEIHIALKQPISSFANLSDDVSLPAEYYEALLYNLAARLFAVYGLPPRSDVVALASAALNTIRNSNTQVGTLKMPRGLPGVGRDWQGGASNWANFGVPPTQVVTTGGFLDGIGVASSSVLNSAVLGQMVLGV